MSIYKSSFVIAKRTEFVLPCVTYIHMYVYMYIYNTCIYIHINIHNSTFAIAANKICVALSHLHTYICMYAYTIYAYIFMFICTTAELRQPETQIILPCVTYIHICVYVCSAVRHEHTYICICIFTIYAYIFTFLYITAYSR